MIIGDTVLSSYISENGIYSGTESLFKIDESTYLNRGLRSMGKQAFIMGSQTGTSLVLLNLYIPGGTAVEVRIERAKLEDAELILEGQRKCFLTLLERYQDHDLNPCNEKLESIQKKHY